MEGGCSGAEFCPRQSHPPAVPPSARLPPTCRRWLCSQAGKLERVSDLALPLNHSHVFVPVDLEAESLQGALRTAGFDWGQAALFS
jgi:hypothetical protein